MLQLNYKSQLNQMRKRLERLNRNLDKERGRAMKDTRRRTLAETNRDVREEYAIKLSPLKKRIRATPVQDDQFTVSSSDAPITLAQFGAPRQTRKGVTVSIRRQSGRELFKSAFIPPSIGIPLRRRGPARLPVRALYGPTAADMVREDDRLERIFRFAGANLRKQLIARMLK